MSFPEFVGFIAKYINPYSGVPGIIFFILFFSSMPKNARIVFSILLVSFVADLANHLLIWVFEVQNDYPEINSYIIGNSWYIINYCIVSLLFVKLVPNKSKFVFLLLGLFLLGTLLSFIFFYDYNQSNTFIRTYSSIAFTFLSILAFFETLRESPIDKLSDYPVFWIITALFLYSSITLLKNLFAKYLVFDMDISWELYSYVHLFSLTFNITKNLMFLYAFVLIRRGFPDYIQKEAPTNA